jgi:2-methylcitrate dehydratase PrpD
LRFEDLPADVVDRAKGVTLHGVSSALLGLNTPDGAMALRLMADEEGQTGGAARVLGDGTRLTKAGAAFVNAESILAGGKWDTFRMLTHPGSAILPAAFATAEAEGARLPFGTGLRHFRCGNRRCEIAQAQRRPDPRGHRPVREPRVGQSGRDPQRRSLAA